MKLNRNEFLKKYSWINKKKQRFVISADYDGLICASFLHHHLNWELVGYYNFEKIWLTDNGISDKQNIIWVDLNILPKQGKSIGGHIISIDGSIPKGFESSCNPNIHLNLTCKDFKKKFPFSTLIFMMWLFNIEIKKDLLSKLFVLHSDNTWLKIQNYSDNVGFWKSCLPDYNWNWLFKGITTKQFEKRIDGLFYPRLFQLNAISDKSKLSSMHYNIKSRQFQFNPDWDVDVIINLFDEFGKYLKWTPPLIPIIKHKFYGTREKISLSKVKAMGLNRLIKNKKIFSYAISSPQILNYTYFKRTKHNV